MTLDEDDVELASELLKDRSGWDDPGVVSKFETRFAAWNGSRYAFAFRGGRVALSACIHALRLMPGDEVILPGYTCVVVPNAFRYAGIEPVFVDIELDTYGIDAEKLSQRISNKTKAILIHHLYGLVSRDVLRILELARKHGIKVIEDCAHATGATLEGVKVGNLGDVGFYSSEQSKIFNTIQGGIAVTNDPEIASGLQNYYDNAPLPDDEFTEDVLENILINFNTFKHPQRWWRRDLMTLTKHKYLLVSTSHEEERGIRPSDYGMKMRAPVACIGLNQLGKIDLYNGRRRNTAERWMKWCADQGYKPPLIIKGSQPVFLRYPVIVEPGKKKNRSWAIEELGVDVGVWFVSQTHPAPGYIPDCPNAEIAVAGCINFPCLLS